MSCPAIQLHNATPPLPTRRPPSQLLANAKSTARLSNKTSPQSPQSTLNHNPQNPPLPAVRPKQPPSRKPHSPTNPTYLIDNSLVSQPRSPHRKNSAPPPPKKTRPLIPSTFRRPTLPPDPGKRSDAKRGRGPPHVFSPSPCVSERRALFWDFWGRGVCAKAEGGCMYVRPGRSRAGDGIAREREGDGSRMWVWA